MTKRLSRKDLKREIREQDLAIRTLGDQLVEEQRKREAAEERAEYLWAEEWDDELEDERVVMPTWVTSWIDAANTACEERDQLDLEVRQLKAAVEGLTESRADLARENERCGGVMAKSEKELQELRRQLSNAREAQRKLYEALYPNLISGKGWASISVNATNAAQAIRDLQHLPSRR